MVQHVCACYNKGQPKLDPQVPNKGGRRRQAHKGKQKLSPDIHLLTVSHNSKQNKNIQKVGTKLATVIPETGRADDQASAVH